jgi:uncharacterized membrane protein YozB (DUF420 family)
MASSAVPARVDRYRKLIWYALLLSCVIGGAAVVRRMVALTLPPSNVPQLHDLDAAFLAKSGLTWIHITCGLLFVALLPFQFVARIRTRKPNIHRWNGRVLIGDGIVAACTAMLMTFRHPIGGAIEAAATVTFGSLFVFALLRGLWYIRHRRMERHREWMIRAAAIALGIATTRPIMGVFFATSALTHLTPHDFFGVAFWLGFTFNLVAVEWWLRYTRRTRSIPGSEVPGDFVSSLKGLDIP